MRSEPRWLSLDEVVELNRDLVADTGEPHQILKLAELESACHRPVRHREYDGEEDVLVLAVKLLFGIARSHGFVQGNKRTGFVAALMFLELNGWSLARSLDSEALGEAIVAVIDGGMSEEDFVGLLAPHVASA